VSLYNVHVTSTHCVSPATYFGALTNWVKLQSTAAPGNRLFFSVVGWYAPTLPQDLEFLSEVWTTKMAPVLASGIDAQKHIILHQD